MIGRNRRGNRHASMKARVGIATAVLIGGGAAGVAAVASNHGPATTTTQSAGFIMGFHHHLSEQAALSSAISTMATSQQRTLNTLAQMVPMRTFTQVRHHHTMLAAQRGVVVLATKRFLLVRSAHGQLHLWWLSNATQFMNVTANVTGMIAMTGNNNAALAAMMHQNMAPAAAVMAGGTAVVNQMAAAVTKPTTITVDTGNQIITITITAKSATVTTPMGGTGVPPTTAPPTPPASPSIPASPSMPAPTGSATATQPPFTTVNGVVRGDMVFVTGVRVHGRLVAKIVLFSVPGMVAPTPTVTPTVTASGTVTPTAPATSPAPSKTAVTGTAPPTFPGKNS